MIYRHFPAPFPSTGLVIFSIIHHFSSTQLPAVYDRHFNNIDLLRDTHNLNYIGVSPIYDSGGSLYADTRIPANEEEMKTLGTKGFEQTPDRTLALVKDADVLDLSKLPDPDEIKALYRMDTQQDEARINAIGKVYEMAVDSCRKFQLSRKHDILPEQRKKY